MTEGTSLNLNKNRSCHRKTESTQEKKNILHEKLIKHSRTSTRKNGLDIIKSILNRITKCDLEWHPYMMHARKE